MDPLAPFIEHLGAFAGFVSSPVSIILVGLLALGCRDHRLCAAGAAATGGFLALVDQLAGASSVGLAAACLLGASAALVQAWALRPVRRVGAWLRSPARRARRHPTGTDASAP
ncbi:hypothetical protein [Arenibaculum sp.]|uniref:hypothetical protein n=1 Tax=Arenibaculum sp. TaxID=2865862 RepID=UPI002E0FF39F|nr:hypothetical protein [Arenibaculum sp.]